MLKGITLSLMWWRYSYLNPKYLRSRTCQQGTSSNISVYVCACLCASVCACVCHQCVSVCLWGCSAPGTSSFTHMVNIPEGANSVTSHLYTQTHARTHTHTHTDGLSRPSSVYYWCWARRVPTQPSVLSSPTLCPFLLHAYHFGRLA